MIFNYQNKTDKKINKLENRVDNLNVTVSGGIFGEGLKGKIDYLTREKDDQYKIINRMSERLIVLEEIVRESGLITDFDNDEVKIREDRSFDVFKGIHVKKVPYQINKVKVL